MTVRSSLCGTVALAGLAALACADARAGDGVEMYGYFDIGLAKQSGLPLSIGRGYNNWLGWRGNEQLGGETAAFFVAELRFDPDTGRQERAGTLMQGETTVGLRGPAGTLRLGRALSPLWHDVWKYEPWINSGLNASLAAYQTGSYSSDGVTDIARDYADFSRFGNAVFYQSPALGGWSMHLAGELERQAGASNRAAGLAFNYDAAPWAGELSFERNRNGDTIRFAAASWKSGKFKLMGSAARVQLRGIGRESVAMVAATYTLGANTLRAGLGRNMSADSHKLGLGLVHSLSKRTGLYADLYREQAQAGSRGVAAGITHSF
jgi:predicted porin